MWGYSDDSDDEEAKAKAAFFGFGRGAGGSIGMSRAAVHAENKASRQSSSDSSAIAASAAAAAPAKPTAPETTAAPAPTPYQVQHAVRPHDSPPTSYLSVAPTPVPQAAQYLPSAIATQVASTALLSVPATAQQPHTQQHQQEEHEHEAHHHHHHHHAHTNTATPVDIMLELYQASLDRKNELASTASTHALFSQGSSDSLNAYSSRSSTNTMVTGSHSSVAPIKPKSHATHRQRAQKSPPDEHAANDVRICDLLAGIGQIRGWTEAEIQSDVKAFESQRLRTVSDLFALSNSSWRGLPVPAIVKDSVRLALGMRVDGASTSSLDLA
ncbi:hypothetical protein BC831DRAFT_476539 [Entophlyctis helioformis]|nr:hypothetical protein BC831DRAFT_476539 [Entophlyctis helioformis]